MVKNKLREALRKPCNSFFIHRPTILMASLSKHFSFSFTLALLLSIPAVAQESDLDSLVSDLESRDGKVRRQAAYDLHQLGPKAADAVPALAKALKDDEEQVFFHAVSALAKIGPEAKEAIPQLLEGLRPVRRRYADQVYVRCAFALSQIGEAAVPPLREALRDPDETFCANAINTFALMPATVAEPAVPDLLPLLGDERDAVSHSIPKALAAHGKPIVPHLQKALAEGTSPQKRDAMRALGLIGKEAGAESGKGMIEAAKSGDPELTIAAMEALVRVRFDTDATTALIVENLRSDESTLSDAAANAALLLSQINSDLQTEAFAEAMAQSPESTKLRFAKVLGRMGKSASDAVPSLISAASEASSDENAATFAKALSGVGTAAVPSLLDAAASQPVSAMNDDHWLVVALGGTGMAALAPLQEGLSAESPGTRAAAVSALGLHGGNAKSASDALFTTLQDSDPNVRGNALVALSRIGVDSDQLLPLLEPLTEDSVANVRAQAYKALSNLNDKADATMPFLLKGLKDSDSLARMSAVEAVGSLGEQASEAVSPLTSILDSSETTLAAKKQVLLSLGSIGSESARALDQIAPFLAHENNDVRLLALRAVASIGPAAEKVFTQVRDQLEAEDSAIRAKAVEAIAAIGKPQEDALQALVNALDDSEAKVRDIAIQQLASLKEDAAPAAPRMFELLEASDEPRPIIDALRSIRARDPKLYAGVLESDNASVRLFACEALGRLGSRAKFALPTLKKLEKDDEYSFVRRRATQAIERINRGDK